MEWIEHLEISLTAVAEMLKLVLEGTSILCVLIGFATTARLAFSIFFRFHDFRFLLLRLRFGSWLTVALECQLGADILATTIAPSWEDLGKLGAIALIRTFLNYFLNQELEAEAKVQKTMKQTKN